MNEKPPVVIFSNTIFISAVASGNLLKTAFTRFKIIIPFFQQLDKGRLKKTLIYVTYMEKTFSQHSA